MAKSRDSKAPKKPATGQYANSDKPDELTLADDIHGRNTLQGNDQQNVRNQRKAVPDTKGKTDELMESFEKLDKDVRARTDLNKGARSNNNKR